PPHPCTPPRALERAAEILTHTRTAGNATAPATDALPLSGTHDAAAPPASSHPLNVHRSAAATRRPSTLAAPPETMAPPCPGSPCHAPRTALAPSRYPRHATDSARTAFAVPRNEPA